MFNLKTQTFSELDSIKSIQWTEENINEKYEILESEMEITIMKNSINYVKIQKPSLNINIKRIFLLPKSGLDIYLFIQYCDMRIELHFIKSNQIQQLWHKEEALAYIEKVLFMKYPFSDHLDNSYHRNLFTDSYLEMSIYQKIMMVPSNIALRVTE